MMNKNPVNSGRIDRTVASVLNTKKYAGVHRAVVERLCREFEPSYGSYKELEKAVKKALHIIYGSYLKKDCYKQAESLIAGYSGDNIFTDRDCAARLMELHASTAERLEYAADIYEMLGGYIDPGDTVIDVGCGFNPFALPYFPKIPASYIAYDICVHSVGVLNKYFAPLGSAFTARLLDAAEQAPDIFTDVGRGIPDAPPDAGAGADVVLFMLKLFPLLEQQRKGRAFELLEKTNYKTAVVSFPIKSVSGREKGMEVFYTHMFFSGLHDDMLVMDKTVFGNEMFFIIKHRD